jgi:hypothetical protein
VIYAHSEDECEVSSALRCGCRRAEALSQIQRTKRQRQSAGAINEARILPVDERQVSEMQSAESGQVIADLPGQQYFLGHGIVTSAEDTVGPQTGTRCAVCLGALDEREEALESDPAPAVFFLRPCKHFFHDKCTRDWHNNSRPERSTCPVCRRDLFVADPLTAAQIHQLRGGTRPIGVHRQLYPHSACHRCVRRSHGFERCHVC